MDESGKRLYMVSNARKFNVEVMLVNHETRELVVDMQLQLRAELILENGCAVEDKIQAGAPLLLGEPLALAMAGRARFIGLQLGKTALTSFCDKQLFRLQIRPVDDTTFERYSNLRCISEPFKSVTKLFRGERPVREPGGHNHHAVTRSPAEMCSARECRAPRDAGEWRVCPPGYTWPCGSLHCMLSPLRPTAWQCTVFTGRGGGPCAVAPAPPRPSHRHQAAAA